MHKPLTFSMFSRLMHWIVALALIFVACIPLFLADIGVPFYIHKSIGAILIIFTVIRLINRLIEGWPVDTNSNRILKILSKVVHWGLLIVAITFPLSGILMSYFGGRGLQVFGLDVIAQEPVAVGSKRPTPIDGDLAGFFHELHEMQTSILIALLALHIIGVIYHQFILKDNTLNRICPRGKR